MRQGTILCHILGGIFFICETKKVRGVKHNIFVDTEIAKGTFVIGDSFINLRNYSLWNGGANHIIYINNERK